MRRIGTSELPKLTLLQGGVGEDESGFASTIYGPVRAGLTTSQPINKEVQLSELLNDLEKRLETLESRYLEACDTLNTVILRLAELKLIKIDTDITN